MPSTGPKNITNSALKRALRKHAGVFVLVAQELGCDRSNVAHRVRRSPELQAFVQSIEEEIGDIAEGVIKSTLIDAAPGNAVERKKMARWYAAMKLGSRGFRTRQEVSGLDGAPLPGGPHVTIVVEYVDPKPVGEPGDVV